MKVMFTTTVLKKKKKTREIYLHAFLRDRFILFYFISGRGGQKVRFLRSGQFDGTCRRAAKNQRAAKNDLHRGGSELKFGQIKVGGFRPIVDAHAIEEHLVPRLNLRSLACTTTDKSLSFSNHFVFSSLCRLVGSFFLFVVSFSLLFMKV